MLQQIATSRQIRRALIAFAVVMLCVGIALWQRGALTRDVRPYLVSEGAYSRFVQQARDTSLQLDRAAAMEQLGVPARIVADASTTTITGPDPSTECAVWYIEAARQASGDPSWEHVTVCFDGDEIVDWKRGDRIDAAVLRRELRDGAAARIAQPS